MQGVGDEFASRYGEAVERLFGRIGRACADESTWALGVRAAIAAVLEWFAEEPAAGRLIVFEPYVAGREGEACAEATLIRLAELLRGGRDQAAESLPAVVEEGLIGGFVFLVGRPLRAGAPEMLPALAPELTTLLLTPYIGREEAERIAAA